MAEMNEYLETLLPKWNAAIQETDAFMALPLQRDFYARNLKNAKERTVVIISDAMRYEVGKELFHRMQDDPKCTAKLEVQLSVLPSYTRLGMAALLPHAELTMTDDFKVLIDGMPCDNLAEREAVLQKYSPDSVCVQFDSIKSLKVAELRSIFTGKQVVYVYHNQIDARGDKPNTEDEVFVACQEAVCLCTGAGRWKADPRRNVQPRSGLYGLAGEIRHDRCVPVGISDASRQRQV